LFSATDGAGSCEPCKGGTTSPDGANSCKIAVCTKELEYYDVAKAKCVTATDGMEAFEFSTLKSMALTDGHWRTKSTSSDIYPCPQTGACIGAKRPADGLLAMDNVTHGFSCRDGHTGPLCTICVEEYFLDASGTTCKKCADANIMEPGILVTALGILFLFVLGICNCMRRKPAADDTEDRERAIVAAPEAPAVGPAQTSQLAPHQRRALIARRAAQIKQAKKAHRVWADGGRKGKMFVAKLCWHTTRRI